METGYKVVDAMTSNPIYISSDKSLGECARLMAEKHVGALLVKENKKLTGIISEQDIVRKTIAKGVNPLQTIVKDVMETELTTVAPNSDINDALIKMRDLNIRHLPVMDEGKLVGLITIKDILKVEPHLFDFVVEKFELREAERKPIFHPRQREGICQSCGEYSEEVFWVDNTFVCEDCKKEMKK